MNKCLHCGADAVKKYCSPNCRKKNWQLKNLHKFKEYNRRYRAKQQVLCRHCGDPVPQERRRSGVVLCSDDCCRKQKLKLQRSARVKAQQEFYEHKCNLGCLICGYDKFGGSLDYHHVDPKEKDNRIAALTWKFMEVEISKCILVCKNCHYELHHHMRYDKDKYWSLIKSVSVVDEAKQEDD